MQTISIIVVLGALLLVLASLFLGLFVMARGGETNKKFGNKLMQLRVYLQGGAILLLVIIALMAAGGS
jgi:hypothetical protein